MSSINLGVPSITIITIVIFFLLPLVLLFFRYQSPPKFSDLALDKEASQEVKDWHEYLMGKRLSFYKSALTWKVLYRTALILTAAFGSIAAVLPHLHNYIHINSAEDMLSGSASVFAACSALLASILGILNCEEYFQLNRKHRYEVEILLKKAALTKVVDDDAIKKMESIMVERGNRE